MDMFEIMQSDKSYVSNQRDMPTDLQDKAKDLCWQINQTRPNEKKRRSELIKDLFGTSTELTFVEPTFHCDYGFNIHSHGLAVINYNCSILDTSPVDIGAGAFIAPGVVLACSDHSLNGEERISGVGTSSPIKLGKNVWIGANSVVLGDVTIGDNSVIGAGSVVNKDIPSNVVAVGSPCKVIRKITEDDKIKKRISN
ncbi:sugar O-acetyltransferase [Companilactobacillus ginsenosidimutans]|uniref:Acetyltransferase n=1 Tax=Companilactobacillus ginsenosidimutans TaxID=1007676 RepID=A0A0H4QJ76_9LACO|nr:sugar O-acetyltransferase [Companilactobacillus ginsenosidimutans]AKP66733.1 transferase [Companilactobacillus ginsenosidimutans]